MRVRVTDPFAVRCDPEEVLGDDEAEELDVVECGFAFGVAISGKAQRGHDPIVEMDVKCGQEGVKVCLHKPGLTPSVFD